MGLVMFAANDLMAIILNVVYNSINERIITQTLSIKYGMSTPIDTVNITKNVCLLF